MKLWQRVTRNSLIWLGFNLGVQAMPIAYLWHRIGDKSKAFWEYVNCTLALLIAIGMLCAVVSDIITERAKVSLRDWVPLVAVVVLSIACLQRAIHDEFVQKAKADVELFWGSVVAGTAVIAVGTFHKAKMWYEDGGDAW